MLFYYNLEPKSILHVKLKMVYCNTQSDNFVLLSDLKKKYGVIAVRLSTRQCFRFEKDCTKWKPEHIINSIDYCFQKRDAR